MHTHFGSAANGAAAFLTILLFGTFWRLGWLHTLAYGTRKNSRILQGLAKAGLSQF